MRKARRTINMSKVPLPRPRPFNAPGPVQQVSGPPGTISRNDKPITDTDMRRALLRLLTEERGPLAYPPATDNPQWSDINPEAHSPFRGTQPVTQSPNVVFSPEMTGLTRVVGSGMFENIPFYHDDINDFLREILPRYQGALATVKANADGAMRYQA